MGEQEHVRKRSRREDGFTLIEVMVALVVFLIGFLGLAGLFASVAQSNRASSNHTRADHVLYQKIEEFMSTPYAEIATGSDETTVGEVVFDRSWTVTPNDPITNVMTIDIEARWTERGDTFRVQQATIKSAN
jgi:type IV pilus assembly protein PilV